MRDRFGADWPARVTDAIKAEGAAA
jgi:hypothetical protein